jgi:sulfur-oxidizing protein SoxY
MKRRAFLGFPLTIPVGETLAQANAHTHLRLNGSQRVVAIAELSDGSFWSDAKDVEVREAACTEG